jgi:uncharacterized protein YciW
MDGDRAWDLDEGGTGGMSIENRILAIAGIGATGRVADVVALRANIFQMTAAAEETVLRPKDAGSWPHGLRAALAARIAALNGETDLAARYISDAGEFAPLGSPDRDGEADGLGAVIAFMDKVASETRDVAAADITALQKAGVADADIVRLSELNAFLAYQVRVIAGVRLMAEVG